MYPWEYQGGLMPWMVGVPQVGSDGNVYTPFQDPNSPTGWSVKHTDQYGTDVQPINAPVNPMAQYDYWQGTPYGKRLAAAEEAAADQNLWARGIQEGQLGVSRGNLGVARMNAQTNRESIRAQIEQAKADLAFKYHQQAQTYEINRGQLGLGTLQLGASLTGPRRWDQYLETAAQAGQNPIIQGALGTWSSLTNVRPNTGAVSGGLPQKFDLNALASDFMGGGVSGQAGKRDENLDRVAMNPGAASPGWWQGLSGAEQERARGYWETRGWDPGTVLNGLAYTAVNPGGLSYGGL